MLTWPRHPDTCTTYAPLLCSPRPKILNSGHISCITSRPLSLTTLLQNSMINETWQSRIPSVYLLLWASLWMPHFRIAFFFGLRIRTSTVAHFPESLVSSSMQPMEICSSSPHTFSSFSSALGLWVLLVFSFFTSAVWPFLLPVSSLQPSLSTH